VASGPRCGRFLERFAQTLNASHQFVEVHCKARPPPLRLNFFKAAQQELPEAQHLFDQAKRGLRYPHPLVVLFLVGRITHLRCQTLPFRSVNVTSHRASRLVSFGHTLRAMRAVGTLLTPVNTPLATLTTTSVTLCLGVRQTLTHRAVVTIVTLVVEKAAAVQFRTRSVAFQNSVLGATYRVHNLGSGTAYVIFMRQRAKERLRLHRGIV
jgi:hypothetical protein